MGILSKEQIREPIWGKLVTENDVQNMRKEMFSETLQEMLGAELDTELGYSKKRAKPDGAEISILYAS